MKVWVRVLLPVLKICAYSMVIPLLLMLAPKVQATEEVPPIALSGAKTQGGMLTGKIDPSSKLLLNQKEVNVGQQGHFVIGFGRDAALEQQLTVIKNGSQRTITLQLSAREYNIQKIEGVAQKYVSPPEAVLQRIAEDNRRIASARATDTDRLDFMQPFVWPADGPISGVYGSQRVFNGVPKRPHFGLDVAGPTGTDVVAPADGRVLLWVADMYYSGGTLILDHGFGISSTFIHLSKSLVRQGDEVRQGDKIAEIGDTGRTTGPHLDWRINWFSERLDPQLLVPAR
jgi:murein DD-endopeptidase MepM/ murein hydrolase activator NlpD